MFNTLNKVGSSSKKALEIIPYYINSAMFPSKTASVGHIYQTILNTCEAIFIQVHYATAQSHKATIRNVDSTLS